MGLKLAAEDEEDWDIQTRVMLLPSAHIAASFGTGSRTPPFSDLINQPTCMAVHSSCA